MIHRFFILDRKKSVGTTLFDTGKLNIQSDLLIGLVQALMLLGEEMGPTKGSLREAELGEYQIGILSKDHLAYIIIQNAYDSEPFTSKIIENVIEEYHNHFLATNFNFKIEDEDTIKKDIISMLTTMKFPPNLTKEVYSLIDKFHEMTSSVCDTLFISDLDDGIVEIFNGKEKKSIIKILMEILSEIPFERQWIGETKLKNAVVSGEQKKNYEAWLIYRIGTTDFCVLGRAYYNSGEERESIVDNLEILTQKIMDLLIRYDPEFQLSL